MLPPKVKLVLSLLLVHQANGQDTDSVLDKIAGAIGNVNTLSTFRTEASVETFSNFEAEAPDSVVEASSVEAVYSFDLVEDFSRVDMEFTPLFETFKFFPGFNATRVIQGDVGANVDAVLFSPAGTMSSVSVGSLKRNLMLLNPHVLLRNAAIEYESSQDGIDILRLADVVSDILVHVNSTTGTIAKVTTTESNPIVRDVPVEVQYSDWSIESNGFTCPAVSEIFTLDSQTKIWSEHRLTAEVSPMFPADHFDLPNGTDTTVTADELLYGKQSHHSVEPFFHMGFTWPYDAAFGELAGLANGVFWAQGAAFNLFIIHSGKVVVAVEGGGNEIIGQRVLEKIMEAAGDATLTHYIQSHHHVDHASGIRTIVGTSGADLVVAENTKEFWEETLVSPSGIRPDILTGQTPTSSVFGVPLLGSMEVLESDTHNVTAFHTDQDPHAEDSVIVAVETSDQVFFFMADLYNAGFGLTVVVGGPQGLFDSLRFHELIDCACNSPTGKAITIVPAHGSPCEMADCITELEGLDIPTGCQPSSCKDGGEETGDDNENDSSAHSLCLLPFVVLSVSLIASLM